MYGIIHGAITAKYSLYARGSTYIRTLSLRTKREGSSQQNHLTYSPFAYAFGHTYSNTRSTDIESKFRVQWWLDRHYDYIASAIHGCFRSSVADFLSSGRHLSIDRMKSRNIFFSSPSSTEILSSNEIVGIVTLLEPPVQCPTELSRVYIETISVTYLARRRLSLLYRCFACIEMEAFQVMQPFQKHDVYLMILSWLSRASNRC
jgi:hypothetical protein